MELRLLYDYLHCAHFHSTDPICTCKGCSVTGKERQAAACLSAKQWQCWDGWAAKKGVNASAFGRCRAVRQKHRDAELMASWFIDPWPACMVDRAQFTLKPTVQRYTKKVFFNTIWSCTNNYKTTLKHLELHSISWHASKIKNIHTVFWTSAAKIQQETVLFYFSLHSEFSQENCQLVTMILSVSSGNMMWIWAEGACNQTSAYIYVWGLLLRISWNYITGHWATERQRQREEIHISEKNWPLHDPHTADRIQMSVGEKHVK